MRHVDAKIKILLVLFYYYNFTFVSIMNCDRQKFSIVTLHESKVHYAGARYNWRKVVFFSDETTIQMFVNTIRTWSLNAKPMVKHPFKVLQSAPKEKLECIYCSI